MSEDIKSGVSKSPGRKQALEEAITETFEQYGDALAAMAAVPNPGSDGAIELGCTCPVMDNGHGAGIGMNGERVWWKNEACPLHGPKAILDDLAQRCVDAGVYDRFEENND